MGENQYRKLAEQEKLVLQAIFIANDITNNDTYQPLYMASRSVPII